MRLSCCSLLGCVNPGVRPSEFDAEDLITALIVSLSRTASERRFNMTTPMPSPLEKPLARSSKLWHWLSGERIPILLMPTELSTPNKRFTPPTRALIYILAWLVKQIVITHDIGMDNWDQGKGITHHRDITTSYGLAGKVDCHETT
jgi:hypothetical protein